MVWRGGSHICMREHVGSSRAALGLSGSTEGQGARSKTGRAQAPEAPAWLGVSTCTHVREMSSGQVAVGPCIQTAPGPPCAQCSCSRHSPREGALGGGPG